MKVLLIGGTGHVGSHLVKILLASGHEVVIGSRGRTAGSLGEAADKVRFVTVDAHNPASLAALAASERFDAVVDFPGTAWNVWNAFRD